MTIERTITRIFIGVSALCLTAASGIGAGQWALAGLNPFYANPQVRALKLSDDEPTTSDFWERQAATEFAPRALTRYAAVDSGGAVPSGDAPEH